MKYNTTLRKLYLQPGLLKKLLFSFFVCVIAASANAQTPCSARVIDDASFSYTGAGPAPARWNYNQADTGGASIDQTAFSYVTSGNFSNQNVNPAGGTNNSTRQYAIVTNPNTLSPQYANIPTDGMLVINPLQAQNDQYLTYNINGLVPGNTYNIEIKVWNVLALPSATGCCGGNWSNWNNQFNLLWEGNANNAQDGQSATNWTGTNGSGTWSGFGSGQMSGMMTVTPSGAYAIITGQVTLASATTGFKLTFRKNTSDPNPIVLGVDYIKVYGCATEAINVSGGSTSVCEATGFTLTAQGIGPPGSTYQWYQNGVLLSGRTSDTLNVVSPVGPGNTATYKAVGPWDNISTTLTSKLCCSSTGGSSAEVLRQSFNGLSYTCTSGRSGGYADIPDKNTLNFIDNSYTYSGTACDGLNDGYYAVVQSSFAGDYWRTRPEVKDHTGTAGSGALFINAIGGVGQAFYKFNLTGLCNSTRYDFSAWYASLATGAEIVPNMRFDVIDNTTGTTIATTTTGIIPSNEVWYNTDVTFQTPAGGSTHTYTLQVVNLVSTGSGNDLMLDDIVVTKCTPFINLYLTGTQVTADTVCSASPVSMSVTTYYDLPLAITGSSAGTVYYQWMSSTVPNAANGTWTLIGTPVTSGTLLVTPTGTTTYYRAKVASTSASAATGLAPLASDCGNDGLTTTFSLTKTGTLNPTATPVNSAYCIGNTMTLTGNPSTGTQWEWRTGATYATATAIPGYTFSSSSAATKVFSKTIAAGDAGYYYFVVQTAGGCTAYVTDTVTINASPTVSNAGPTQSICSTGTATLAANTATVGTGAWTVTSGPSTSAAQLSSTSSPTAVFTPAAGAGTYVLQWSITNASCTPSTSTVTITVTSPPTVSVAGPAQTICSSSTATLAANTAAVGTGTWSVTSGPSVSAAQFSSTSSPTAVFTPAAGAGTYLLQWSITNLPCPASNSTVTITVKGVPTASVAGPAQSICSTGTATLAANTAAVGTGTWSVTSGPSVSAAQFSSTASPTALFTPAAGAGTYVLQWSITNVPCPASNSTVTITVTAPPTTSVAGPAQTICSSSTATLAANTAAVGTGTWSVTSGPSVSAAQFSSTASPTAVFTPAAGAGTYVLQWSITNLPCPASNSTVTITVKGVPTASVAGPTQSICSTGTATLAANTAAVGTGTWSVTSGPSTSVAQFSSTASPTAVFTPALAGTYILQWSITNVPCPASNSTVTIKVTAPPTTSVAGTAQSICGTGGATLAANTAAVGTGTWSVTSGPSVSAAQFSSTASPTAVFTPAGGAGVYVLQWSITNAPCPASNSTVTITFNTIPAITVTKTDPTSCASSTGTFVISGLTPSTSYIVNYKKAGVAQAAQTLTSTAAGTITIGTLPAAAYTAITVTTAAPASCVSNAGSATLSDPSAPGTTAGTGGAVCEGSTLSLTATAVAGASFSWSGPNSYSASGQNQSIPSTVFADSGSYTVTVTLAGCTGTSSVVGVVNKKPVLTITNPTAVCSPTPVDLTAATVTTGSTLPAGTTLGYYTNAAATATLAGPGAVSVSGTYYIKAATATCSDIKPVVVKINTAPTISVTKTDPTSCATSTGSFTISGLAVTTSYTVNYSKAGVAQAAQTLTSTAAGTITIGTLPAAAYTAITVTTASTCISNAGSVTLSDPSAPSTTAGTGGAVCEGSTLSLTATTVAGASYSWSGPNSYSAAGQNQTIPAAVFADSGSYTVTITLAGCTGTSSIVGVVNKKPVLTITNPLAVCSPSTVKLTAATVTTGSTLPAGTTLGYYTDAAATATLAGPGAVSISGTYYIKASTATCSDIKPVVVTINTAPTITITKTDPTSCATSTGSFTINGLAATTSYTVSYSKAGVAQAAQTLTSTAAGTITIGTLPAAAYTAITVTTASSCISNAGSVTLSDPSAPSTTAGTGGAICEGSTLSLTATTVAGASYSWSGPNSYSASGQNQSIPSAVFADSGSYTVTITLAGCTGTSSIVGVVNKKPVLTITNPTAVCSPTNVDLTAATVTAGSTLPAGTSLGYYTDAAATTTVTTPSAVSAAGTYYIKALSPFGCSDIKAVIATINAQPTFASADSLPCAADHLHYSVYIKVSAGTVTASSGTVTFSAPQWIISGILASDPNVTLTVTSASGCINTVVITSPNCSCPSLPITVSPTDPTTCNGTDGSFKINGLTAAATYLINFSKGGVAQAAQTLTADGTGAVTVSGLTKGSYTSITATITATGCVSTTQTTTLSDPASPTTTAGTLGAVCSGNTLSLTANTVAGATYAWTGPNSFTSGAQNPAILSATIADSGTYSLTITLAGCAGNSTVVGVVNQTPTLTVANPGAVCSPNTVDITAPSVTAGSTGGTSLAYFTDAAATTPVGTPGAVAASGTYYIKYASSTCSVVKPVVVTINTTPTLTVTDPAAVCSPNTVDITAAAVTTGSTGGTSFAYFTDASATTPVGTPGTVGTSGTYYIKYASATCNVVGPVVVTINTPPTLTVTNPGAVCSPGAVDITAASVTAGSTGGTSFAYFTDAAATTPLGTPGAVSTSGTYYIQYASATCSTVKPVVVTINTTPTLTVTDPGAVCSPNTVDITAASVTAGSTGGTSFAYFTDAAATTALGTPGTVGTSGTYYIKYSSATCSTISPVVVTINTTPTLAVTNPGAVCSPGAVDITAASVTAGSTGGTSFAYFTDAAATTPLGTPGAVATSGTYYIQYASATCSTVKPVVVTINTTPTLTVTDPAAVCSPNTVDITAASVTAGSTGGTSFAYFTDAAATTALGTPGTVGTSGTYYIKYSSATCSTISPVVVTINTTPTLAVTNPGAVCSPNTVDITSASVTAGSTGGTSLAYFTDASATTPLATPAAIGTSGTYYIQYASATCSTVKPVVVTINTTPTLTITDPAGVCSPGTVDLTAASVTAGSTGGTSLGYFTDAAATTALGTPGTVGTSGTYYIKYASATCSVTQPVTVTINPLPVLAITDPVAACSPGTVDITAPAVTAGSTGGTGFAYFTDAAATTPLANPAAVGTSGTYYIKYISASSCSVVGAVQVVINPTPSLAIQNPNAVCSPGTVDITGSWSHSTLPAGSVVNYYANTADIPTTPLATPEAISTGGVYYIVATAAGCSSTPATVTVTINQTPFQPIPTNEQYCQNASATKLTAQTSAPTNTLYWYPVPVGGNDSTTIAPVPSTKVGSTVPFKYYVAQKAGDCISTRAELDVLVTTMPTAKVSPAFYEVYAGNTFSFSGTATGGDYVWESPTDPSSLVQGTLDQTVTPPSSEQPPVLLTTYTLVVTSTQNANCTTKASTVVTVVQPIVIPNTFSPNGDGINDVWDIRNIEAFPNAEVSIFNRYGQFVYKSGDGYRTKWHGTDTGGNDLPVGTYFYIIKTSGSAKPISGSISIVR
jgi:gliding motility-associated-like protein